ncbi:PmoA family protein [Terriglobus aquaticus]
MLLASSLLLAATMQAQIQVTVHEADRRIDVTADGKPFTSYIWPTSLEKPVLYPLIAPDGTTVTRGFPLEPRPGERVDHPHHAGLWFNYGNVNGFDFWNNSGAIPAAQKPKMGTVHQGRIVSTKSGKQGEIVTETTWTDGTGTDQLKERTTYIFRAEGNTRTIDRISTLTALRPVTFHDDKEGLLGIRVAHFLESPTEKGGTYNDAQGRPTKVDAGDTSGQTGIYRTSEGITGDKVWSTRGAWCELTGTSPEGKTETIAILDNPANPGFPTYWHARGYGLFAANPLGDHIFDPKAPEHNFTVPQGGTATFRYRILLTSGAPTPDQLNTAEASFAKVK